MRLRLSNEFMRTGMSDALRVLVILPIQNRRAFFVFATCQRAHVRGAKQPSSRAHRQRAPGVAGVPV